MRLQRIIWLEKDVRINLDEFGANQRKGIVMSATNQMLDLAYKYKLDSSKDMLGSMILYEDVAECYGAHWTCELVQMICRDMSGMKYGMEQVFDMVDRGVNIGLLGFNPNSLEFWVDYASIAEKTGIEYIPTSKKKK